MAKVTATYRKGRLIQALFVVLKEHPDGLAAKDAIAAVQHSIELSPSETGAFEQSGQEKFPRLIRFATIAPVKAGWRVKEDGTSAVSLEDDEDAARAEILDYIAKMPPYDFQTCCAELVKALGHEVAWIMLDGADFIRLWIEHYHRLNEEARALLRLGPIWRLVRPLD